MSTSVKYILTWAVGALALAALSGCFTGIEKTPVIKDTSSSKSKSAPTQEQTILSSVVAQSPAEWVPGKPFIVAYGRLTFAYAPTSEAAALNAGDTLRFASLQPNVRLAGDSITEVYLTTPSGKLIHTVVESPISAISHNSLPLPFLVDIDLVDAVRNQLKGKTVWTLRPGRDGRKYQRTRIADVLCGNADFPLLVITETDTLRMVLSSRSSSARTFDNLFSLSDPRKRYPQISDPTWDNICRGKIAVDMTREECRLALGAPASVERTAAYAGIIERWTYEDGKFLIFTDGLLTNFRL